MTTTSTVSSVAGSRLEQTHERVVVDLVEMQVAQPLQRGVLAADLVEPA